MEPGTTILNAQSQETNMGTTTRNPQAPEACFSRRQAIFAFIVPVSLSFLQIKYQGKDESPFETHPQTVVFSISSLLISCVSFDVRSRISTNLRSSSNYYYYFFHSITVIFGLLCLTSIVSILVPEPVCPVLFALTMLLAICEIPLSQMIRMWKWLLEFIGNRFSYQLRATATTTTAAVTTTGVVTGPVSDERIGITTI
ncbi:hypothetical protein ACH5RR_038731 [Cinchona calisaya]|uniref:Uncharacterized protein n=1 Tax=Cinchona calisaya TaxID=153742 RepID=A0ABD2Y1S0_9GENT